MKAIVIIKSVFNKIRFAGKLNCGMDVIMNLHVTFQGHNSLSDRCTVKNTSVGFGSYIGHDAYICWSRIGKYCSIAPQFSSVIGRHPLHIISTHPAFFNADNAAGFSYVHSNSFEDLKWIDKNVLISIGNDVWIGQNAKITDGVSVGDGAVIAANSFVNSDVPNYAIVGGTPAKILAMRFKESEISYLERLKWWNLPEVSISMLAPHFGSFKQLEEYIHNLSDEITVIIPCYNKSEYIEKCIFSIEDQILRPYEVIIVDDCSADDSSLIYSKLVEMFDNIKIIRLEKNMGVSNARNVGLNASTTSYVTFIDADDYYCNHYKLLNEVLFLKKNEAEGRDVLTYSRTVRVSVDGTEAMSYSKKTDYLEGDSFIKILATWKSETIPRDYCIKRSLLLKAGGYNENCSLYEDLELLLKLTKDIHIVFTNADGTCYRQVENGLSRKALREEHKVALFQIRKAFLYNMNWREKSIYWIWRFFAKIRRSLMTWRRV